MSRKQFRGYCLIGCGKPVFSKDSDTKYCSPQCANEQFKLLRRACLTCGIIVSRAKHKYCSPKCSNARFKRFRPDCLTCGEIVARANQKYCSVKCQHAFQFKLKIAQLESGTYRTTNYVCFVRQYLLQKYGERCTRCGWAERHGKTGRVPLEVEHIDGNHENNLPENLTLLCPNCHSLTHTFRALNRGRGRARRLGGRQNPLLTKR